MELPDLAPQTQLNGVPEEESKANQSASTPRREVHKVALGGNSIPDLSD